MHIPSSTAAMYAFLLLKEELGRLMLKPSSSFSFCLEAPSASAAATFALTGPKVFPIFSLIPSFSKSICSGRQE